MRFFFKDYFVNGKTDTNMHICLEQKDPGYRKRNKRLPKIKLKMFFFS